jgi:hypothetical protein
MKKHLIVLFLLVAQLGAFYLKANAQDSAKVLLADETTLSYTEKYAKIECDNEKVFMKLFTTHYQIISRFTASWKVDKRGRSYKRYTVFLNKEDSEIIKSWANKNL